MTTASQQETQASSGSMPQQRFYPADQTVRWIEMTALESDGGTGSRVTLASYPGRDDLWTADVRFRKRRHIFGVTVPFWTTDVVLRIYVGQRTDTEGNYAIHRLRTVYYADGTLLPTAHEHEDCLADCGNDMYNLLSHFVALRFLLESQGYKPLREQPAAAVAPSLTLAPDSGA